ncbi:hypothetical protein ALC56_06752 [Trachymyrmex septentrionalis]|uniref:Uncharacterized protein n=1 Tax=Trachymyrmex septentrionalis TaxID=34720 RepID=A0A195FEC3_9HYME|nr:hypothetical protein ALC56_06752 [Trachymyrmex septentrionalis]
MLHHSLRLLRLTFCFYDGNRISRLRHSILTSSSHTAVQAGIRRLETSATRAFPNDSIFVLGEYERIQLLFRNLHGSMKRHKSLHSGAIFLTSQLRNINQSLCLSLLHPTILQLRILLRDMGKSNRPGSNVRPSGEMLKRASWSRRFQEISP